MKRFVLDASVTMSWCFEDQQTRFSEAVLTALKPDTAPVVPSIWIYEVVNVLAIARKKNLLDRATAITFWNTVSQVVTVVESNGRQTALRIIDLCERYRLTAYDAAYMELALRENLPLATLDKGLKTGRPQAFGCSRRHRLRGPTAVRPYTSQTTRTTSILCVFSVTR